MYVVVVVQWPSHVWLFATPWTAACQAALSLTISWSLPKFMFIASVMPPSHFILWCPLLLLPSIVPSTRDFSNEWSLWIRWPKYWSFSFSISPSSEYSGLISINIDWFHLLAVQGTFRSLLQLEGLNSVAFCLPYGLAFTTTHDHWYADDTTLMAESKEELKSLLMRVKEESETAGLRLNIKKTKIMAFGPITAYRRGTGRSSDRFPLLGL